MQTKGLTAIGVILNGSKEDRGNQNLSLKYPNDKYISREFQKYGYDLAEELNDLEHKALYIKMAKETPRVLIETAKNFVKDAYNVKNKARLFMWKLKQLKAEIGSQKVVK
jgi:hypothetical protein